MADISNRTPVSSELKEQVTAFIQEEHLKLGKPAPAFTIADDTQDSIDSGTVMVHWTLECHFSPGQLPTTFTAPDGTIHPIGYFRDFRFSGPLHLDLEYMNQEAIPKE